MTHSRVIFLTVCLLLISLAWAGGGHEISNYLPYYAQRVVGRTVTVTIQGQAIYAEVAESAEAKAKGLSGRRRLQLDHGMYFPFETAGTYEFWMPDMYIPLDIVWVHEGVIVDISRAVPVPRAGQEPARVRSAVPASTVLEVRAGVAVGWLVGDRVDVRDDRFLFR